MKERNGSVRASIAHIHIASEKEVIIVVKSRIVERELLSVVSEKRIEIVRGRGVVVTNTGERRRKSILHIICTTRTHARRTHTFIRMRACGRAYTYRHVTTLHTRHTRTRARACARVCMYSTVDEYIHVFVRI